jgi:hypothetical protein
VYYFPVSSALGPTARDLPADMRLPSFISPIPALAIGAAVSLVHATSLFADADTLTRTRQSTFHSQIQDDTNLRYVTNSGICETTPGVTQYSGYVDVGTNMSMVSIA